MQHHGTVCRTTHSAIRDPHEVPDAALKEDARDRQIANFGDARVSTRSRSTQDQDGIFIYGELRVVY